MRYQEGAFMFKALSETDVETILTWRNQAQVRKFSFSDCLISREEHYSWWQKVKVDPSKKWLLFEVQGESVGVVYYCDIIPAKEAYWGFYFSNHIEDYKKLKLWFSLEEDAINYAFNELQLVSLRCEVLKMNKAALVMHKRFGYKEINKYQHARGEVIVLELQQSWIKNNGR